MKQQNIFAGLTNGRPAFFKSAVFTLIVLTLSASSSFANCDQSISEIKDTILVQKQHFSKKHKINLYPNASHEVLFFSANGLQGRVYQLFLFDLEGKLIKQATIKNKQTTILDTIEKGSYLFEIFSDDERIENGQLSVR